MGVLLGAAEAARWGAATFGHLGPQVVEAIFYAGTARQDAT